MFKFFILFIIVAVPILYFTTVYEGDMLLFPVQESTLPLVHIENVPLRVSVADTPKLRVQGLSGRVMLASTEGMLFIFDESAFHQVWMKDMLIPIDVIWIDENFVVVDITRNLRPESYPKLFEPVSPVRFAIEVNSNYAESFGITVGDVLDLPRGLVPEDLRR